MQIGGIVCANQGPKHRTLICTWTPEPDVWPQIGVRPRFVATNRVCVWPSFIAACGAWMSMSGLMTSSVTPSAWGATAKDDVTGRVTSAKV